MKVRLIPGIVDEYELIELEASTTAEAKLLDRLGNEGVRVTGTGHRTLTICSPKLANLTAYYLDEKKQKLIHDALVQAHTEDRDISSLLTGLFPQSSTPLKSSDETGDKDE